MSQKFIVTAVDRSAKGLHHVHRAGRAWPSSQDVVVEVLDQDACPMVKASKEGYPDLPDPNKLGKIAWAAVMADGRLSKRPFGTAPDASEIDRLKAKVAELENAIVGTQKERDALIATLGEVEDDRDTLVGQVEELKAKADAAQAKVAELESLLESLTTTKPEEKKPTKKG